MFPSLEEASTIPLGYQSASVASADLAGLSDVRFHDLRHTFGTQAAAAGAPSVRAIQAWMGHADQRTTGIYVD